jgi:putative ABC transport system permease protein
MFAFAKLWVWRMALRDLRRGMRSLLFSMSCVVLAVASVALAFSFRENLLASVQAQSKSLLGADLALESREAFSAEDEKLFASLGGDQSRQVGFSSMAYFSASGESRLVQVRAINGKFPYYGALETEPPFSFSLFAKGANALVDENVMLQFNAKVGDRVKIGNFEFAIAGSLRKIPGESLAFSLISPRIYIPMEYLDRTQLVQKGSLVRYRVFFKFDGHQDVDKLVAKLTPTLQQLRLEADTVSKRAASVAGAMENLSRYLRLAVFVAVLLAGVGVASVMHVYAKDKARGVALLRCVGAAPGETLAVYLLQILLLTLVSSGAGAALGIAAQDWLPYILKDFLPVATVIKVTPNSLVAGVGIGMATALSFALLPLLPLRRVTPLLALRSSALTEHQPKDLLVLATIVLIAGLIVAFAVATTGTWLHGTAFTGGVFAVFALLVLCARGATALMSRYAPKVLTFAWRQGLANLYRPNNQTLAVTLSIGLGAFLLVTLYSTQDMLVQQMQRHSGEGDPNLVLFDVQSDQRKGVAELLSANGVPLRAVVPVITMRLTSVKGRKVEDLRADQAARIPDWALRREYRSTYRSELSATEAIVKGRWQGKVAPHTQPIPVSVEKGIAETLKVDVGDDLQFEVQGVPVAAKIASLREVEWQRVQPNFFVVFPEGVLEGAPQFYAVVARADSAQASAKLQRAVVEKFTNVSVIDLSLILSTLNSILSRVSYAMRFVALFTILTGLAVLISAVLGSRMQRLKESVLLRTLGAARGQIFSTVVAEYLFLGGIASIAGALLGSIASWGLSYYFFGVALSVSLAPTLVIVLAITAATVAAGGLGCVGMLRGPVLDSLRAEA